MSTNLYHVSVGVVADILYAYSTEKRGSDSFIKELVTRLESCKFSEISDSSTMVTTVAALHFSGRRDSAIYNELKRTIMNL